MLSISLSEYNVEFSFIKGKGFPGLQCGHAEPKSCGDVKSNEREKFHFVKERLENGGTIEFWNNGIFEQALEI